MSVRLLSSDYTGFLIATDQHCSESEHAERMLAYMRLTPKKGVTLLQEKRDPLSPLIILFVESIPRSTTCQRNKTTIYLCCAYMFHASSQLDFCLHLCDLSYII